MRFKDITAVCVDTKNHALANNAARVCASKCDFGDIVVFSDIQGDFPTVIIPPLKHIPEYNEFILDKIVDYIHTDYTLVFQWDGFVTNPELWVDEFKDYDYIGAPWNQLHVGNGGFSLRSRRLLERTRHMPKDFSKNEDGVICQDLIPHLADEGFAIAPANLAMRFSFETTPRPLEKTFGFHGDFNFAKALSEDELRELIGLTHEEFWTSRRPFRWINDVIALGDRDKASRLLEYCREIRPAETTQWFYHNTL